MRDRQTDRDRETYRWQNNQTKAKEFQRREGGGERMRDIQAETETERLTNDKTNKQKPFTPSSGTR